MAFATTTDFARLTLGLSRITEILLNGTSTADNSTNICFQRIRLCEEKIVSAEPKSKLRSGLARMLSETTYTTADGYEWKPSSDLPLWDNDNGIVREEIVSAPWIGVDENENHVANNFGRMLLGDDGVGILFDDGLMYSRRPEQCFFKKENAELASSLNGCTIDINPKDLYI